MIKVARDQGIFVLRGANTNPELRIILTPFVAFFSWQIYEELALSVVCLSITLGTADADILSKTCSGL
jgi:hypothetical protein